ncbi:unnamed protein product [Linum trigynum]|uniref:Secreted protein n=1 Tax=Linum trigynum TaxID=586398 RepID=A0AAV2FWD1_9ROSI
MLILSLLSWHVILMGRLQKRMCATEAPFSQSSALTLDSGTPATPFNGESLFFMHELVCSVKCTGLVIFHWHSLIPNIITYDSK